MQEIPVLGLLKKLWHFILSWIKLRKTVLINQNKIKEIEKKLCYHPPQPEGIELIKELYWGKDTAGDILAYCPACFGKGDYMPMQSKRR